MRADIIRQVGAEELRRHLEEALGLYFEKPKRVSALRRRRSNYSSSYTIENLEVELDGEKRLSLVFKNLSPAAMLETARQVRPGFLCNPRREIEVYRSVLSLGEFGTPEFFGSIEQPENERYGLFLERVEGPLLWQVGRFGQWQRAARWLAGFHEHFRQNQSLPTGGQGVLLSYDKQHCLRWIKRAEKFLLPRRGFLSSEERQGLGDLMDRFERVVDRLLTLPQTLIHGEFYPSNVLLRQGARTRPICPIDWEAAAIGPGLIDLAALTSGNWTQSEKQRLVTAYLEALPGKTGLPATLPEVMELVEYCQLYLAVQWLGWAADWSPPKSHERNWLREALRLSRRLGLFGPIRARVKPGRRHRPCTARGL